MRKRSLAGAVGTALIFTGLGIAAPAAAQSPTTVTSEQSAKTAAGAHCRATSDGVRIRKYPNTVSKIVGRIPKDGKATCYGEFTNTGKHGTYTEKCAADNRWIYVNYRGHKGWAAAWCLSFTLT